VARDPPSVLLRRRLVSQGLAGPTLGTGADGPVAVARRLLAAREDYPLLQALTAPPVRTAVQTRLLQHGIDAHGADRAVAIVDQALADAGPLSRHALRDRLLAAGVPAEGQALVHVLIRASLDGLLVRGPVVDGEHLYVRLADWLPEAADAVTAMRADRRPALAELAARFLAGHGPADERDLARWAGVPLRDARAGFEAIAPRLRFHGPGLVELADGEIRPRTAPPRAAQLLGAFEPLLMGWRSREAVLGAHEPTVVSGGIFRSFALVRGRACAVWRLPARGVALEPFTPLDALTAARLQREGEAVARFLGR
jgi:hypothetical protein